jgi:hypothetical protein
MYTDYSRNIIYNERGIPLGSNGGIAEALSRIFEFKLNKHPVFLTARLENGLEWQEMYVFTNIWKKHLCSIILGLDLCYKKTVVFNDDALPSSQANTKIPYLRDEYK